MTPDTNLIQKAEYFPHDPLETYCFPLLFLVDGTAYWTIGSRDTNAVMDSFAEYILKQYPHLALDDSDPEGDYGEYISNANGKRIDMTYPLQNEFWEITAQDEILSFFAQVNLSDFDTLDETLVHRLCTYYTADPEIDLATGNRIIRTLHINDEAVNKLIKVIIENYL